MAFRTAHRIAVLAGPCPHVSAALLLPNNLERDLATRIEPLPGQAGDSVADVAPVERFEDAAVIEGVY